MARQNDNRQDGQAARERRMVAQPAPAPESARVLRIAALVAMAIGLTAVTAAACVLSYEPIHRLAIQSGVSSRLASVYPLIFDALLVLAGCSVLALRGGGLGSRIYAWLCMLVLLSGLAAGGAVHASGVRFSRKAAGITAAVIPWVLVLIGFGLLLALLRYARMRRQATRASFTEHHNDQLPHEPPDVVLTKPLAAASAAGSGPAEPAARSSADPAEPAPRRASVRPSPTTGGAPLVAQPRADSAAGLARPLTGSAAGLAEPTASRAPAFAPAPANAPTANPAHVPPPADAPVPNPALAALAVPRSHTEPVTTPQPAVTAPGRGPGAPRPGPADAAGPAAARTAGPAPAGSSGFEVPGAGSRTRGAPDPGGPGAPGGSAGPDLAKSGQHKLPVRQADLQLRARIPRPAPAPASDRPPSAEAGPAQASGRQDTPFTPRVGTQQPTAGAQPPAGVPPASQSGQTSPRSEQPTALNDLPPSPAGPPSSGSDDASAGTDQGPGDGLSAAPTDAADEKPEDNVPGGPPELRRQRSSPTPPNEE